MAAVAEQYITVGHRIIGGVSVDGGAVRGDGGSLRPRLLVPVTIALEARPAASMIALVSLRASFFVDEVGSASAAVGLPTSLDLVNGLHARSLPKASNTYSTELRVPLTAVDVHLLETARHRVGGAGRFTLHMRIEAVAAGLRVHNELPETDSPWASHEFGMYTEMMPFWDTRVSPLAIGIEQSVWVRDVLPGFGHGQVRLVELRFPPPLPKHVSGAATWDKAVAAFDAHRYEDCLAHCRSLLTMWQRSMKATKANPLVAVVAGQRNWSEGDARRPFLDGLWKAAVDVVNAPHHPEGVDVVQQFGAEDARLVLQAVAALSEYVSA